MRIFKEKYALEAVNLDFTEKLLTVPKSVFFPGIIGVAVRIVSVNGVLVFIVVSDKDVVAFNTRKAGKFFSVHIFIYLAIGIADLRGRKPAVEIVANVKINHAGLGGAAPGQARRTARGLNVLNEVGG